MSGRALAVRVRNRGFIFGSNQDAQVQQVFGGAL